MKKGYSYDSAQNKLELLSDFKKNIFEMDVSKDDDFLETCGLAYKMLMGQIPVQYSCVINVFVDWDANPSITFEGYIFLTKDSNIELSERVKLPIYFSAIVIFNSKAQSLFFDSISYDIFNN